MCSCNESERGTEKDTVCPEGVQNVALSNKLSRPAQVQTVSSHSVLAICPSNCKGQNNIVQGILCEVISSWLNVSKAE